MCDVILSREITQCLDVIASSDRNEGLVAMHAPRLGEPRRHCLLPFQAQPDIVGDLRRTVHDQLKAWGAAGLTDVATLAVSELATNVIRHVGAGTPAALVMEARDNRLCVELHDTSRAMPRHARSGPDDLTGRGLALVAAVADRWFATPTPGGKAVCCEFATDPTLVPYHPRAVRGSEAAALYALQHAAGTSRPFLRATVTDLITDLLHWLAVNGEDPDAILDRAQSHFEAEAVDAPRDLLG
jgi:anti-sigma regulatory factor (Ser/Thr protein kinase)